MARSAWSISAAATASKRRCCTASAPAKKYASPCGRKILRSGANGGSNAFRARVLDRRYQGTQTAYDIDLAGHHLEVLELGTAARHDIGTDAPVSLPREALWAYRDQGALQET